MSCYAFLLCEAKDVKDVKKWVPSGPTPALLTRGESEWAVSGTDWRDCCLAFCILPLPCLSFCWACVVPGILARPVARRRLFLKNNSVLMRRFKNQKPQSADRLNHDCSSTKRLDACRCVPPAPASESKLPSHARQAGHRDAKHACALAPRALSSAGCVGPRPMANGSQRTPQTQSITRATGRLWTPLHSRTYGKHRPTPSDVNGKLYPICPSTKHEESRCMPESMGSTI